MRPVVTPGTPLAPFAPLGYPRSGQGRKTKSTAFCESLKAPHAQRNGKVQSPWRTVFRSPHS
jgi:hypothetical protein